MPDYDGALSVAKPAACALTGAGGSPSGTISTAEENLRTTLADAATFRALCGITAGTDAQKRAAALLRIYREGLPPPADHREFTRAELEALRPCAIVFTSEQDQVTLDRDSAHGFAASGTLTLLLVRTCGEVLGDGKRPTAAADREWADIVGTIHYELADLAASMTSGYLGFQRIRVGTYNVPENDVHAQGVWQGATFQISWRGV